MRKDGYTMTEIIVVIIILGIIMTLAIPQMGGAIETGRSREGVQILEAVLTAQRAYEFENTGIYFSNGADISGLDVSFPPPASFLPPVARAPAVGSGLSVADITRSDGSYRLEVCEDGVIVCADLIGANCDKIGYDLTICL